MNIIKISKKLMSHILVMTFMISLMITMTITTEASGIDNIVARADYLYSIKWTAQKDVNGWKNRESNKYIKGEKYRIPYGQPVSAGKYICWGVSVEDFYNAAMDKESVFYSKRSTYNGAESVYYAMDCSAFVSYCWGLSSRTTTTNWSNLSVESYGKCTKTNIQKIQKGDALNLSGSHIMLVTDVVKSDGVVTKIEITEQTPPQIKRTTYTVSSLASNYGDYTIYRYNKRNDVKAPPVPAPPEITSVSATADTEITVKWNSVAGATEYVLEGRKSGDSYEKIAEISGTSYTHKNLDGGSLYWYRVKAKNDSGKSGSSNASAAYTKPATPTSSSSNSTTSSIKVSWSSSGGSTSYELLARKCGENDYTTVAENIDGNTYTHTGLEAGTQYYYKIKAHNKEHTSIVSARSDAGSGFTKINAPTVTAKTAKTVALDWSRGVMNGDYTYTYCVKRKVSTDATYTDVAIISNSSYTDNSLKPNTTYYYYIDVLRNGSYIIHSEGITVTTDMQYAESVYITPDNLTLVEGDSYALTATVLPYDANDRSVVWSSDNTGVVSVSGDGAITALSEGVATIAAKTSNGHTAVCRVTVESLQDNCSHSYGSWTIATQANCTDIGYKYRVCSICGKTEGENIPAAGHSYSEEWVVTKEATCAEYGERKHFCSMCGEADESTAENIAMIQHNAEGEWMVEKEATCSEPGVKYRSCSVCGEKCESEEISVTAHTFDEEWETEQEATCQQEKVESRSCTNCGEKEYHYEDKAEHNYVLTELKDPTDTEEGYATYTCSYCEDSYTDTIPVNTDETRIFVNSASGKAGSTVDIAFDISKNPGIAVLGFDVNYDKNALTLEKATLGSIFTGELECNLNAVPFMFNVYSGSSNKNGDGTLVTLTFKVNENCEEGDYEITISNIESLNIDEEEVYFAAENGVVTVINSIPGDVTGDGSVTRADLLRLAKHFSGFTVELDEAAADVTGDGVITRADLLRLAKHFSGFDVVLGA